MEGREIVVFFEGQRLNSQCEAFAGQGKKDSQDMWVCVWLFLSTSSLVVFLTVRKQNVLLVLERKEKPTMAKYCFYSSEL